MRQVCRPESQDVSQSNSSDWHRSHLPLAVSPIEVAVLSQDVVGTPRLTAYHHVIQITLERIIAAEVALAADSDAPGTLVASGSDVLDLDPVDIHSLGCAIVSGSNVIPGVERENGEACWLPPARSSGKE